MSINLKKYSSMCYYVTKGAVFGFIKGTVM